MASIAQLSGIVRKLGDRASGDSLGEVAGDCWHSQKMFKLRRSANIRV
jgi:hypothetical protein